MYVKFENDYADRELQLLAELLSILDEKLAEVSNLISKSVDPESDGLTDRGEYFIGVGFSVIQQYLTDTLTLTGMSKRKALDIGPRYSKEFTFISVVNAAANWWKHSAEWVGQETTSTLASRTQRIVIETAESLDYPLSNVLAKLLGSSEIMLCALLPNLVLWRSAIDTAVRENA
ncbi:hypothetical protein GCM10011297_26670 [Bacterioplanes sanyensis]|uniref:hypothetical protein n=1 Tax=Bacterioplanes sanyensis TaxID=1249553 RepID=UPI00167524C7|nr:hypothetical protein [Bacterioplanes sanyensis]GGY52428.1 hypothetical protein GCM10011297_26670 [Bacterioplanes sanyensis]